MYVDLYVKKLIGLMKNDLGEKIRTKFFLLSPKTYSCFIHVSCENEKGKDAKDCVIKKT